MVNLCHFIYQSIANSLTVHSMWLRGQYWHTLALSTPHSLQDSLASILIKGRCICPFRLGWLVKALVKRTWDNNTVLVPHWALKTLTASAFSPGAQVDYMKIASGCGMDTESYVAYKPQLLHQSAPGRTDCLIHDWSGRWLKIISTMTCIFRQLFLPSCY